MTGHMPARRLHPHEVAGLDQAEAATTTMVARIRAHHTSPDGCVEPDWCVPADVPAELCRLSYDELLDVAVTALTAAARHWSAADLIREPR